MKKRIIIQFLLVLGLAVTSQSILSYEGKIFSRNVQVAAEINQSVNIASTLVEETPGNVVGLSPVDTSAKLNTDIESKSVTESAKPNTTLSRGGSDLSRQQNSNSTNNTSQKKKNTYSSKAELLDWWKSARNIFAIGTVAEVKDLYTGKTFKAKRTMGTNHADTEALTKKDTEIIKSIWGGFSWTRRPVILTINGKNYAASMSAMPHAGLDSAPAYAVIDNRSEDYGRGENLDVIKGNGMDGHFDIHFLNSTRHKDGKEDPEHQAAVLKAAGI